MIRLFIASTSPLLSASTKLSLTSGLFLSSLSSPVIALGLEAKSNILSSACCAFSSPLCDFLLASLRAAITPFLVCLFSLVSTPCLSTLSPHTEATALVVISPTRLAPPLVISFIACHVLPAYSAATSFLPFILPFTGVVVVFSPNASATNCASSFLAKSSPISSNVLAVSGSFTLSGRLSTLSISVLAITSSAPSTFLSLIKSCVFFHSLSVFNLSKSILSPTLCCRSSFIIATMSLASCSASGFAFSSASSLDISSSFSLYRFKAFSSFSTLPKPSVAVLIPVGRDIAF